MKSSSPLLAVAIAALLGSPALAATPIGVIASSSDTTVDLTGTVAWDDEISDDDFVSVVAPTGPPGVPENADLTGYHRVGAEDLFSLDITTVLGGLTVRPSDVVRWDGSIYTLELDGAAEGVPVGARIDAISVDPGSGDLLLSFDIGVDLGGGLVAADEDIVAFDSGTGFSSFFDGSAFSVPENLDVDAIHAVDAGGNLALSFDTSGTVGAVSFDDEDVVEYDAGGASWSLAFDGSAEHAGWTASDLDAVHLVPEPGFLLSLGAGLVLVRTLHARRRGRTRRSLSRYSISPFARSASFWRWMAARWSSVSRAVATFGRAIE